MYILIISVLFGAVPLLFAVAIVQIQRRCEKNSTERLGNLNNTLMSEMSQASARLVRECFLLGEAECMLCESSFLTSEKWNSSTFCEMCVEKHSEELYNFTQSSALIESLHWSSTLMGLSASKYFVRTMGILFVPILVVAITTRGVQFGLEAIGALFLFSLPLGAAFVIAAMLSSSMSQVTVFPCKSELVVLIGSNSYSASLMECTFHAGRYSETNLWKFGCLITVDALVICLPVSRGMASGEGRIGIPASSGGIEAWQKFSDLCRTAQLRKRIESCDN